MTTFDEWVDTLPPALADRPHVVYIAWHDDLPLYVGMTNNLERRLSAHRSSKSSGWTTRYTHIEFVEVKNRTAAERLERQVIADLRPGGNRWQPTPFVVELTEAELLAGDQEAARLVFGGAA